MKRPNWKQRIKSYYALPSRPDKLLIESYLDKFDGIKVLDPEIKGALRSRVFSYRTQYEYSVINNMRYYRKLRRVAYSVFLSLGIYLLFIVQNFDKKYLNSLWAIIFYSFGIIQTLILIIITSIILFFYIINHVDKLKTENVIEIIIFDIIDAIYMAERKYERWMGFKYKEEQLRIIENIARSIEYFVPRRLSSGDVVVDEWLKETTKQVAAAMREKKKWILMPSEDTRDSFVESMASTLVYIVSDDWSALEHLETKKLTRPELRRVIASFTLKAFRTVLVALLPTLGFLIFQQTPLAITGVLREYIIVGLLIWGLLAFIAVLDQNFSAKISAIKDITGLLTSPGTGTKSSTEKGSKS